MISKNLQKIIDTISVQGEMNFLDGARKDQIAAYEKKNHITLPIKYKEWLLFSDGGECFLPAGVQFYGIEHNPIIDIEDTDRPDDNYIVIGALASGEPIVFKKSEEKISIYNHAEQRIEDDETYEDFYIFLKDMYNILGISE